MTARPPASSLEISPLAGALGAEVRGLSLAALREDEWKALHEAWLEHLVLFFPDQHLEHADHVALGRRFGEIEIHPFIPKVSDDFPQIVVLDAEKGARADTWHTDVTFSPTPPMASILSMVLCPDRGGDTLFTNQYLAYETLSDPIRELVEGLTAVHTAAPFGRPEVRAEHPAIRIHPETGRRSLYVNRTFTSHFKELRRSESDSLLRMLCDWSEQPAFQVRYRWSKGAVGIWDNRCTMHFAINDYGERPRVIERVTVLGDAPQGPAPRWRPFEGGLRSATGPRSDPDGAAGALRRRIETDPRTNSIATPA
ncbi:TauD/TfdA family dioxygenase [Myxococcota bacterium]|nr:TauD/TfdA family dioxygenase [Myxococcota bacterium]